MLLSIIMAVACCHISGHSSLGREGGEQGHCLKHASYIAVGHRRKSPVGLQVRRGGERERKEEGRPMLVQPYSLGEKAYSGGLGRRKQELGVSRRGRIKKAPLKAVQRK